MVSDGAESTRTQQPSTLVRYFEAAKDLFAQAELGSELIGRQSTEKVLKTEGLTFTWGSGPGSIPLFRDIELSHQSNSNLGIIGLSGVGKSTLAEVLLRLTLGEKGKIQWFDSGSIKEPELRRRVQYVFQDCERAMAWEVGTLEETMLLPLRNNADRLPREVSETMTQVLTTLGLMEHKDKNVQHLSGGQLRRAYLARSLLTLLSNINSTESVLLILDEVTVGLDLIAQHELLKLLRRYTMEDYQNMSLLAISHDPIVIQYLCNVVKVLYKDSDSTDAATIVEELEGAQIWQGPYRHEHTKMLMGALH
jgi:iron complex transport system ATP-binding protein